MPAVDRNVLRIGVFELLWADDVPDAVAVDEAIALVRELSTDESPGLRQRRARQHPAQKDRSSAELLDLLGVGARRRPTLGCQPWER